MIKQSIGEERQFLWVVIFVAIISISSFSVLQIMLSKNKIVLNAFLSIVPAIIPITLRSFRVMLTNHSTKKRNEVDCETLDILTYGHSGSGKTELIKGLFTFGESKSESTEFFEYHVFPAFIGLGKKLEKEKVNVRIADYRGQQCSQLYDAARENDKVNALLFVVDIAPAYGENSKYSDEDILFLFSRNPQKEIEKRVSQHMKYINEFTMQTVLEYASSDSLKSVRLIINKIDLLIRMKELEYLDRSIDVNNFVMGFFCETIEHLKKYCEVNNIPDFKVITTSALKHINTKEMLRGVLEVFLRTKKVRI
jgi:GTPase SAR1 family protein